MEISVFIREYAPLAGGSRAGVPDRSGGDLGAGGQSRRVGARVRSAGSIITFSASRPTGCPTYGGLAGGRSCRPARYVSGSTRTISARSWITAACFARPIPGRRDMSANPTGLRQGDRLQPLHQRGERRQPGSLS